jgi:hypothetical protein
MALGMYVRQASNHTICMFRPSQKSPTCRAFPATLQEKGANPDALHAQPVPVRIATITGCRFDRNRLFRGTARVCAVYPVLGV